MKALTVRQLAKLSGVTVRTLHYYDEVGLLKPTYIRENGYRYYGVEAQVKLQQILFFKELDFSLEQIQEVLNATQLTKVDILEDQKKLLKLKRKRLDAIIVTIGKALEEAKGGETMKQDDLFGSFNMDELKQYEAEAKKRWGHADAYKESVEKTKHWTKNDIKQVQKQWDELLHDLAETMDQGVDSEAAQTVVDRIYRNLFTFYTPTIELFRGLGQMYVEDTRFKETFEKVQPGLAQFACDAIAIYCDNHIND